MTVTRESQVANGIHASVNGVQPPPPHPPIDRVLAQPKRHELSTAHDPVLPPRKLRNRPVPGVLRNLTVHYAVK
jgi:hypothetical protein